MVAAPLANLSPPSNVVHYFFFRPSSQLYAFRVKRKEAGKAKRWGALLIITDVLGGPHRVFWGLTMSARRIFSRGKQ